MQTMDARRTPQAADLRAEARELLDKADRLRREAEEAEHAAWRLQAAAAVLEAGERSGQPARHRPGVSGHPGMACNRVLVIMERLGIDEPFHHGEGLDAPLRGIEARLGICYARRGVPPVGRRIAAAEEALDARCR